MRRTSGFQAAVFCRKMGLQVGNTDRASILIAHKMAVNSLASLIGRIDIKDVPGAGGIQFGWFDNE
jgi:hypothetical protein